MGPRAGGARTQVTGDLDASRDDRSQPILPRFLWSSLFHLRPELTGPATPKPAGSKAKLLARQGDEGWSWT